MAIDNDRALFALDDGETVCGKERDGAAEVICEAPGTDPDYHFHDR